MGRRNTQYFNTKLNYTKHHFTKFGIATASIPTLNSSQLNRDTKQNTFYLHSSQCQNAVRPYTQ